jgi:hypothetical protein
MSTSSSVSKNKLKKKPARIMQQSEPNPEDRGDISLRNIGQTLERATRRYIAEDKIIYSYCCLQTDRSETLT